MWSAHIPQQPPSDLQQPPGPGSELSGKSTSLLTNNIQRANLVMEPPVSWQHSLEWLCWSWHSPRCWRCPASESVQSEEKCLLLIYCACQAATARQPARARHCQQTSSPQMETGLFLYPSAMWLRLSTRNDINCVLYVILREIAGILFNKLNVILFQRRNMWLQRIFIDVKWTIRRE